MAVRVPPIKSQGIKTKLVSWINDTVAKSGIGGDANWFEPFFGTGVVGFNSPLTGRFCVGDTNPYIIKTYQSIQDREITKFTAREYFEEANHFLSASADNGNAYYKYVRDRFNKEHNPLDFLFLSRAGFNGMMRFNRKGEWNIPFCKKPDRFQPAYITKICNQIDSIYSVMNSKVWSFNNVSFEKIIPMAGKGDIIYCDPPYYGRYVDYYNGWTEQDEYNLFELLVNTEAKFILSTWHHNQYRKNEMIDKLWGRFNILTKDHFYHGGGSLENRHPMVEALVCNFDFDSVSAGFLMDENEITYAENRV